MSEVEDKLLEQLSYIADDLQLDGYHIVPSVLRLAHNKMVMQAATLARVRQYVDENQTYADITDSGVLLDDIKDILDGGKP